MRTLLIAYAAVSAFAFAFASPNAHAEGCLKGAAVGAFAGHLVHHGVTGAIVGCAVGHEQAKLGKEARSGASEDRQGQSGVVTQGANPFH